MTKTFTEQELHDHNVLQQVKILGIAAEAIRSAASEADKLGLPANSPYLQGFIGSSAFLGTFAVKLLSAHGK